jgi:hypothetical protein
VGVELGKLGSGVCDEMILVSVGSGVLVVVGGTMVSDAGTGLLVIVKVPSVCVGVPWVAWQADITKAHTNKPVRWMNIPGLKTNIGSILPSATISNKFF